jgi:hypothetical protein
VKSRFIALEKPAFILSTYISLNCAVGSCRDISRWDNVPVPGQIISLYHQLSEVLKGTGHRRTNLRLATQPVNRFVIKMQSACFVQST